MAISLPDLVALRHRIESDIQRMTDELHAVQLLERRIRAEGNSMQPELELRPIAETGKTFADEVRRAVRTYTQDEFTVANVQNFLVAHGVKLPAKNTRARIAMILQDLTKKGEVRVTYQGKGNAPYRYRLLPVEENAGSQKAEGRGVGTPALHVYN